MVSFSAAGAVGVAVGGVSGGVGGSVVVSGGGGAVAPCHDDAAVQQPTNH